MVSTPIFDDQPFLDPIPLRAMTPTLLTRSARELAAMNMPPLAWAVDGLLPQGLSLLAGKPKTGKSWLALSLGLALAGGRPALEQFPVTAGEVLYLALEDTDRRLKDRITKLAAGTAVPDRLALATVCPRLDQGGSDLIDGWLTQHPDARLVIVDTWAKVRPTPHTQAGVYLDDYAAVRGLKQVADHRGLAILLIHHLRKQGAEDPMDEISGSTGLTGAADGLLVLKRSRGKAQAELYVTGRDLDDQELALTFDKMTCRWLIADPGNARADTGHILRSDGRQSIADLLGQVAPQALSPTEIASRLERSPEAIRQLLSRMARDDEIAHAARGLYRALDA